MPSGRNWLFTINNPQDGDTPHPNWPTWVKIVIFQQETGTEGTVHLQGYLEAKQSVRMSQICRLLPRAHLEKRKGTRAHAIAYVTKEETRSGETVYYGITKLKCTQLLSSKSTTVASLQKMILENPTMTEEQIADEHFNLWVRYHRAIAKYLLFKTPVRNWAVEVIIVIGPTGTGKSRWAMDNFEHAYWKQRSQWWDGYGRHSEIIIDEFYGWLPFDLLLRLCDRYPLLLETKGGQVQCVCNKIIITSNTPPHKWYNNCYFDSLKRRFSKILVFNSLIDKAVFTNYNSITWD